MNQMKSTEERSYAKGVYASQLVTFDDLHVLRKSIVEDILSALNLSPQPTTKKWLKSHEVRQMLQISPGTLQNFKNNGVIPYTKIGKIHFFDYEEIRRLLDSGKINYPLKASNR